MNSSRRQKDLGVDDEDDGDDASDDDGAFSFFGAIPDGGLRHLVLPFLFLPCLASLDGGHRYPSNLVLACISSALSLHASLVIRHPFLDCHRGASW